MKLFLFTNIAFSLLSKMVQLISMIIQFYLAHLTSVQRQPDISPGNTVRSGVEWIEAFFALESLFLLSNLFNVCHGLWEKFCLNLGLRLQVEERT